MLVELKSLPVAIPNRLWRWKFHTRLGEGADDHDYALKHEVLKDPKLILFTTLELRLSAPPNFRRDFLIGRRGQCQRRRDILHLWRCRLRRVY
jgi:hypothetical protein